MKSIRDLIKEFQTFCKLSGGRYEDELFPKCKKLDYEIKIEYLEDNDGVLEYLSIIINSSKSDFEFLNLKNVSILDIERQYGYDKNNELSLYILSIMTDKGNIYIKRSSKEDKIYLEFEGKDLNYQSSIIF